MIRIVFSVFRGATVIVIGTSGYHYPDWVGNFYPEGTKKKDMLQHYALQFQAVELNFTYYGIPKPSTFENMLARTPENFEFVVKANKAMTHQSGQEDAFKMYRDAIHPLVESGRLIAVLAQFPWAFKNTPDNRNYLYYFRERLPDTPLVAEFRHNSWQKQDVFDSMKELNISYCSVDEPKLRDLPDRRAVFTADPAYVRFHSRDAGKWYGGDRYDYLYTEEELEEWLPKIEKLVKQAEIVCVFFNNCHGGQAAQNARRLAELLEV